MGVWWVVGVLVAAVGVREIKVDGWMLVGMVVEGVNRGVV